MPATINDFLLRHDLRIAANPCISPDFCLDWPTLRAQLSTGEVLTHHPESSFATALGTFNLVENASGDHAWIARAHDPAVRPALVEALAHGMVIPEQGDSRCAFPASWDNLLRLKNLVQVHDPTSTIFPSARGSLSGSSLGIGARFTTLHWPAVEWAMAELGLSMTANQNSIPRELVYDVDAMLAGRLDSVPFPFIGANVPEGHQGQSVEGMSHGAVLSKLKTGFHRRRIDWGFNADHQPVGGTFDQREERLVAGCLLASYITFDLSPELSITAAPPAGEAACAQALALAGAQRLDQVRARVQSAGVAIEEEAFARLIIQVWPAIQKMKRRDERYAAARLAAFTTTVGRDYFRELSIDELPGLTTPATLATMLALCESLGMVIHFVAPAFGFQKNFPFADNAELERRIAACWAVCQRFQVSIGFHSGSGKSAENYRLCGRITGGRLEIKTSGRYTYEMGAALAASSDPADQALWSDWYAFTRELACQSAFSENATERGCARQFIVHALELAGQDAAVFADGAACRVALARLRPNPDHMFWFEYNFLYLLASGGRADKVCLGDHGPDGYRQRARFYAISAGGRLLYAQGVAHYICFLAETTGLASSRACVAARTRLAGYASYQELVRAIAPSSQP
jgi:hypothetical protein